MQSLKRAQRDNLSLYFEAEIIYKLQGLEMVFTTSPPKLLILLVSPPLSTDNFKNDAKVRRQKLN